MDYTKAIGNITELRCITEFIKNGYDISIPYGDSTKYDFIVDNGKKLWKIQCKSSHATNNHGITDEESFSFCTTAQTTNTKGTKRFRYTKDEVDYFATCYNDIVYIIPLEETCFHKTLRLSPPKNNNKNYNKAEDYLFSKYFPKLDNFKLSEHNYKNRIKKDDI